MCLFYRAFDRERQEKQGHNYHQDDKTNSPDPKNERLHPLKKRRDRFQKYVQELPFLGFYSGKYDLNGVKEFLFLVLAQEGVPFTIKRNHNFICIERALLRLHISVFLMSPTFCRLDSVATSFSMPKSVLKLKGSFHMNG